MRAATRWCWLFLAFFTTSCAHFPGIQGAPPQTVVFMDEARNRPIPVAIYGAPEPDNTKPLAIISHGYGSHNKAYSFLANALVKRGYMVASIQHLELPGDPPMILKGENLAPKRLPIWRIGAGSIAFVASELKRRGIADPEAKLVLVGHSNGGDMSMYFAAQHPKQTAMVLSLDNRRMPLPLLKNPQICSIRSSDQAPDRGVIPTPAKKAAYGLLIANVPIRHNDMWDGATDEKKQIMLAVLSACLDEQSH